MTLDDILGGLGGFDDLTQILGGLIKPHCPKCRQTVIVTLEPSASTKDRRMNVCLSCSHSWEVGK